MYQISFLVIFSLLTNDKLFSEPASTKLGCYPAFRIRNSKLSYYWTRKVAIHAFSLGKFPDVRKYACVKYLTNIMSALQAGILLLNKGLSTYYVSQSQGFSNCLGWRQAI